MSSAAARRPGAPTGIDVSFGRRAHPIGGISQPDAATTTSPWTQDRVEISTTDTYLWRGAARVTGVLRSKERADILRSGSEDSRDLVLSGRDAAYFIGRWGGLRERDWEWETTDQTSEHNATLNGTLSLYALAPLVPRPQGYLVTVDGLAAPVDITVSDRKRFAASLLDAHEEVLVRHPWPTAACA